MTTAEGERVLTVSEWDEDPTFLAAVNRATAHFNRALQTFVKQEQQNYRGHRGGIRRYILRAAADGIAVSLAAGSHHLPDSDYLSRKVFLDELLNRMEIARRLLAHVNDQPVTPTARQQELTELRKSVGRLYGIIKDMESRG